MRVMRKFGFCVAGHCLYLLDACLRRHDGNDFIGCGEQPSFQRKLESRILLRICGKRNRLIFSTSLPHDLIYSPVYYLTTEKS